MHIPLDRCTYNHRCQSSGGEPRSWCYSHRLLSFQKHQVRAQYRWYASHFPFAPPNLSRCFLFSNGGRNVVLSRKINTCHLLIKFSVRLGSCHARFLPPSAATVGPQTVPGTITFVVDPRLRDRSRTLNSADAPVRPLFVMPSTCGGPSPHPDWVHHITRNPAQPTTALHATQVGCMAFSRADLRNASSLSH